MTLNINIGNLGANAASKTLETLQNTQANTANAAKSASSRLFSISKGAASPEDIAAAAINDSALTRDDPLGNLVKSAFNLPPPPPPWGSL